MAGRIVAGRYVRAACQRHLDDLASGALRGLHFRPEKAQAWIGFFEETLSLKPGLPFKLADFQAFIIGSLFGWWREDAAATAAAGQRGPVLRRRFRTFFGEMGKGNGKTPLAAGCALGGLTIDTEHAPEIYFAAAAKDQARIALNDSINIVRASPLLNGTAPGGVKVEVLTNNLSLPARAGKIALLSSEDKVSHGLRVHMGWLDEIHAHGSAALIDTIEAGTKNCRNALIGLITNSGHDRRSACWHYHTRALEMLRGKPDDDFFAYVCTLDPCPACAARGKQQPDPKCKRCDDWRDEKVWAKANPGLGTILDIDYLRSRVHLAQRMPSKLNNVLQLNFCQWTESSNGWADLHAWRNLCHEPGLTLDQFIGQECTVGMDAANRVDATCVVLCFERQPGAGSLDPASLDKNVQAVLAEAVSAQPSAEVEDQTQVSGFRSQVSAPRALSASGYAVFLLTYIPEAMVENTTAANHEAYQLWRRSGPLLNKQNAPGETSEKSSQLSALSSQLSARWPHWLTVTPGASTDFGAIEADLLFIHQHWPIRRLQADPRELGYLLQRVTPELGESVVVQVAQGPTMISQPMKEFEGLIASGLIKHDGNPVLEWMLGNVEQKTTSRGGPVKYYYPTRPTESQKIDAVPAALMALDGSLRAPAAAPADPGMVVLG